ncbi:hypothetical protein PHMEG_00010552 [Phytophthora megakarya]|uniref:Reverse transcriptase domain-containing protein n=1 Tax=Phytophthora megakarya TaxID=4795 RepID=A0A225WFW1_9STRA|nr:hypothetical protein PHMEG_00010552 [Phytophthora megakarya]
MICLHPNATPYRCKVRQYSPDKSEFMAEFNKKLVSLGWKSTTGEFRQTVDCRPTNGVTEPMAGVMPSLEVAVDHCTGKMFYAVFDFLKGFWQLPLAKCCQEIISYMTDRGVFTPTRVPQGSTDAALHF